MNSKQPRFFLLILLVLIPFAKPLFAQDSVSIQLKWWNQFQFAGFYAAQQQGYYKEEGIDVKIIPGEPRLSPVDEVLNGHADFGVTGSDLLIDYLNGKPVVALGVIFQHSPYVFLSLKENNINRPADLMGKKVMVSEVQGWVQLKAMLLKEGIDPDSVTTVTHTWNNNDLINGNVDAMSAYSSVEPFQLKAAGANPTYLLPVNYGVDFYGDVLFTSREMTENNPALTQRVMRASFKGWMYAMEHIEEMADYILTLPGVKERGVTRDILINEGREMRQLVCTNLVEAGHMNRSRWEHILATYKETGIARDSASMDGFMYEEKRPAYESYSRFFIIALISLVLLLFLLMINSTMLRRLVRKKTAELEQRIAEKDAIERELRKSHETMEIAAAAAGLGIWDWKPAEDKFQVEVHWLHLFGYAQEDVPQDANWFAERVHPDDLQELNDKSGLQFSNQQDDFSAMYRFRTKDNRWKWVLSTSKAIERTVEGMPLRIIGVTIDIDLLKNKEKELYALSRELTHMNKELQQFAYVTSHNLRSPVANIISLSRLIPKNGLSSDASDLLEKISFCALTLQETLDDLNTILTKGFSAHLEEESELVFTERLDTVTRSIGEFISAAGATITSDFSAVPGMRYPQKVFDSILLNFITNAIKYRHRYRAPDIRLRTREEDGYYVLEIADNGSGIDLARHGAKLFRLYQRFHSSGEGKGIGLYLVKNQVESLEGKITVTSEPGAGTVFSVYFIKNRKARDLA